MYAVPKNRSSEKEQDEEFRKIVADLEAPVPETSKIFCSTKVKHGGIEEVILIPHFRDCLDKNGEFSEKKFEQLSRKLDSSNGFAK